MSATVVAVGIRRRPVTLAVALVVAAPLLGAAVGLLAAPAWAAAAASPSAAASSAASPTPGATGTPTPKITLGKARNPKNAVPSLSLSASGKATASGGVSSPVVRDFVLAIVAAAVCLALGLTGLFATRRPRAAAAADAASPVHPREARRRRHGR